VLISRTISTYKHSYSFGICNYKYANYSEYSWGCGNGTLLKHTCDITGQAQKCSQIAADQGQEY